MYKKTITYTDYNGVQRKEDFYFNLSRAELMEMELTTPGGMADMISKIVDSREDTEIAKLFKKIIVLSYGEKSPDGKYFDKGENNSKANAFLQTEAYSVLFSELASNTDAASEFINGIIPSDLRKDLNNQAIAPLA